jgi:transposase-like protein/IS1 family transposase
MTCPRCEHDYSKKHGTTKTRIQRYRCKDCGATFSPRPPKALKHHTTSVEDASRALSMLLEGMSIRAVSRLTGLHKSTLGRLTLTAGLRCQFLLDERMRGLSPRYVQADELWGFVAKKQKRVSLRETRVGVGDCWLWIALDSDTKAVVSYYVGKRTGSAAHALIGDLRRRTTGRFQLTTDGFDGYPPAVLSHFGPDIDYAQLVKIYATPVTSGPDWWRPTQVGAVRHEPVLGNPDVAHVSTSHVDRFNLSVRTHMRRFTRLTNGFSKSLQHMRAAVSLFVAWYNFCRPHLTHRVTPAVEAGVTDHVWTVQELLSA